MKISAIQLKVSSDRVSNLKSVAKLLDEAYLCESEIVLLPEFCSIPFVKETPVDEGYFEYAERIDGPTNELIASKSYERNITIISSIFEKGGIPGVYYNTSCTFYRGELISVHRKTHLPFSNNFPEKFYFRPGGEPPPVANVGGTKIGTIICYERHFPELSRSVALQGASILFIPVAVSSKYMVDIYHNELKAHAIFNTMYVVCANRIGVEGSKNYFGSSVIYDPNGVPISHSEDTGDNEVITAEVKLDNLAELRITRPFLRDYRSSVYINKCIE